MAFIQNWYLQTIQGSRVNANFSYQATTTENILSLFKMHSFVIRYHFGMIKHALLFQIIETKSSFYMQILQFAITDSKDIIQSIVAAVMVLPQKVFVSCSVLSPTLWTITLQAYMSMGFFQARTLEWAVISFSREAS